MDLTRDIVVKVQHVSPEKLEPGVEIIPTTYQDRSFAQLSPFDYRGKQREVLEHYHPIWPWFFESEYYTNWMKGRRWQLHCYSEPECGKTTLAAEVARQLQDRADHENGHAAVIVLFLSHQKPPIYSVSNPIDALWRTVLRQLAEILQSQGRIADLLRYFSGRELESQDMSLALLKMRVNDMINHLFDSVYIIVDDIDRCSPDQQTELRVEFNRLLKSYRRDMKTGIISTGQFRLPGASRYNPTAQVSTFDQRTRQGNQNCNADSCANPERLMLYWRCPTCVKNGIEYDVCQLCYEGGKHGHDPSHVLAEPYHEVLIPLRVRDNELQEYVRHRIGHACEKSSRLKDKLEKVAQLKQAVESRIIQIAATSLVIARTYTDHLFGADDFDEILNVLDHVAQPERKYFGRLMEFISKQSEARSLLAFRILYLVSQASYETANRHLDCDEIVDALTIHDDEDEEEAFSELDLHKILEICKGMLTVSYGDRNLLRTFHEDVTVYLYEDDHEYFEDLEIEMTDLCLKALMNDPDLGVIDITNDDLRQDLLKRHPFLVYASQCWGYHLKQNAGDERLVSKAYQFLQDKRRLAASLYIACTSPIDGARVFSVWPGSNLLHVCAFFNIVELMDLAATSDSGIDYNILDPILGRTPLHIACQSSSFEFVKALLDRGANPDILDRSGCSVLHEAVNNTDQAEYIVDLLAQSNCWSTLNLKNNKFQDGKTALMLSAANKIKIEAVDQLCSYNEIDVNAQDARGRTALMHAVSSGNSDAVEVLLERPDINLELRDKDGQTVFHMAADAAKPSIRDMIFDSVRDTLNVPILDKRSSISQRTALVILLDSLNSWPDDECVRIIQNLVQKDCEIDGTYNRGQTLMHHACTSENQMSILNLLHERNLSPNAADDFGWTPLHIACAHGASKTASRLMEIGVEIPETKEPNSMYPSDLATLYGHDDLAVLVKQYEQDRVPSNVTIKPSLSTSLCYRIQKGSWDHKQSLSVVDKKDVIAIDPLSGHTALHKAVMKSDPAMVESLLQDGRVDLDAASHPGDTALGLAVRLAVRERKAAVPAMTAIVKSILKKGAKVDVPDASGMTPFSFARQASPESDVTLLLMEHTKEPIRAGSDFPFMLSAAIRNKNRAMIDKLLAAGANMLMHNHHALLPIQVAEEPKDAEFLGWMRQKHLKATEAFSLPST